jgi:excisionase family DNA binding protein
MDRLTTIAELAEYLNIHRATVYRLLKSENYPALKSGRNGVSIELLSTSGFGP